MRQRIVSVAMRVTAVAIILFALPLAAAAYLFFLSDERAELERAAVVAAARARRSRLSRSKRRPPPK